MEKLPKISVITVVRNDVQHIEETMLSVLNQTYPNIEYIVIDGASTDGTWEKIRHYNDRLAYSKSEPDKGIYDAMNKGIKIMTGDWCIFMNCGDSFYDNEVVSKVFFKYKDQGDSLLYGDIMLTDKGDVKKVKARAQQGKGVEEMPSFHQAIFIKTSEMRAHPYDLRYKIIADYAFFYELYNRNNKYRYFPVVIANYEYEGLTSLHKDVVIREKFLLYLRHFDLKAISYFFKVIKCKIINN